MKCLRKFKWVKLPRDLDFDAKGLMTDYTEDRVTMPSQEQVVSIFKEILIRARNTHTEGTRNEKLNRFVAWLSRRMMKAWEESIQNQSDACEQPENESGMGLLKSSVAFLPPYNTRVYFSSISSSSAMFIPTATQDGSDMFRQMGRLILSLDWC